MIVYLHGLESSPNGLKGRYLKDVFGAYAVDLDTSIAIKERNKALSREGRWTIAETNMEKAFKTPMIRAMAAIDPTVQLMVGSSFGGAVLMKLIASGAWRGPSLFICPAVAKLTPHRSLPIGFPAIILHGRRDKVIPLSDSRQLAESGGPGVMLWEIDDDHRMRSILKSGILNAAVNWLLSAEALTASSMK